MAVSAGTQSYCIARCTEANPPKHKRIFSLFFIHFSPSWFHFTLWGSAPSEQAPPRVEVCGLSGYLKIGLDFSRSWEWGDGGL